MSPVRHWTPADCMAAINRARQAWEASQPQTFLDLWPDVLEQADAGTAGVPGGVGLLERDPGAVRLPLRGRDALDRRTAHQRRGT